MRNAFLFPGQGSQTVGMGKDLAERYELAQRRYREAADILGFDLAKICFEGPDDALRQTRVTQPALYVHSCIVTELLADGGIHPDIAAGHSLGEYSALCAAGAFSFADGLRLVKARAEAMQMAGEMQSGTMAAIVGLDDEIVRSLCIEASGDGVVVPANYNSPGQLVISGTVESVRRAVGLAKEKGARLAKELPVSGAFHSPLMQPAAHSLSGALASTVFNEPRIPVISNVTAMPHSGIQSIRKLLADQLLSPVRWSESMSQMAADGVDRWFEIGSGSVLAGLLKRIVSGSVASAVGTNSDLEKILSEAKAAV